MKGKHVRSKDPRKPSVVAALRERSGASRVTDVRETSPGVFEGTCHANRQGNGRYTNLGRFAVRLEFNDASVMTVSEVAP
jgi:hypothetical protein